MGAVCFASVDDQTVWDVTCETWLDFIGFVCFIRRGEGECPCRDDDS